MANSFGSEATLRVADRDFTIFRLDTVEKVFRDAARLPYSLKILLENLLRTEDGRSVRKEDIEALATWDARRAEPRDCVHPQPRTAAGLHRRPGGRGSGRHA